MPTKTVKKVISRSVEEAIEYHYFAERKHVGWRVTTTVVENTNSPKIDIKHGISTSSKFSACMKAAKSSDSDYPFTMSLSGANTVERWVLLDDAEKEIISSIPSLEDIMDRDMRYMFQNPMVRVEKLGWVHNPEKMFAHIRDCAGEGMWRWESNRERFKDIGTGQYPPVPIQSGFGFCSSNYTDIRVLIERLRTLDNVMMYRSDKPRGLAERDEIPGYPEAQRVPYYNREGSGEFEVSFIWLPTQEQMNQMAESKRYFGGHDEYELRTSGFLPLADIYNPMDSSDLTDDDMDYD